MTGCRRLLGGLALALILQTAASAQTNPATTTSEDTRWMLETGNKDRVLEQLSDWTQTSLQTERAHPDFQKLKKKIYGRITAGNGVSQISALGDHLVWMEFSDLFIEGRKAPLVDLSRNLKPPYLLNGFHISPDQQLILLDVSENGGEFGTSYICDAETGEFLYRINNVEMGSASWLDARHVVVSKAVPGSDSFAVSQHVFDVDSISVGPPIFGSGFEGIESKEGAYPSVWSGASDSDFTLGYEWRGDNFRVFSALKEDVIAGIPDWDKVSTSTNITDAELFGDHLLYIDTGEDGQQAVFRRDLTAPDATDQLLIPSSEDFSPQFMLATRTAVFVIGRNGAFHRMLRVGANFSIDEVDLPVHGSILVDSLEPLHDGDLTFEMSSPAHRSTWIRAGLETEILLQDGEKAQTANVQIDTRYAVSADGTEIPLTLYHKADAPLTGALGLIEAYGSYGETQMVAWDILSDIWLEQNAVFALCHTRGGGYFGRPWHLAGKGPDKSAAHEDLIACAETLAELTGRDTVGAVGGSAAGVVVGPASLMRPDLISAVMMMYSWLNPTEFWSDVNGPAQIDEMGDPHNPEDRVRMAGSDALLMLDQVEAAPSTYICLGGYDTRVSVWHSARYIQRLKERFPETDVFVRLNDLAGHACSFGGDDLAALVASQYLWLEDALTD